MNHRLCRYSLILAVLMIGCAGSEKTGDRRQENEARREPPEEAHTRDDLTPSPHGNLAPAAETVRTIQVYRTGDEQALPIITLGSNQTITVAFDLLETRGRPLSVYFYHANRTWRRDLSPTEYLDSFQRDDLLDYQPSQNTGIPYTHYRYRFPNRSIEFKISGNYILRVTEQGMEDEVLFERVFFVSEQATPVDVELDNVMLSGFAYPAVQPVARFTPPPALQSNAFNYTTCFVRNGQLDAARCSDRPMLADQPALQFFLPPGTAFEPAVADYFVDLGDLRVGGRIERTDLTSIPFKVFIEPDYARFAGSGLDPLLNGQIVVDAAVRGLAEPGLQAEYVEARFAYVPPDELPVAGDVILSGSFNGFAVDPQHRLEWVPERRRYEGRVLLKQGRYEYRYVVSDGRIRRAQTGATPRLENLYSVFVYFSDLSLHTDRLIAVSHILVR
ncbi:type IX secretion system plug protein domain-containing protein [Rhodocaloribacter litoris]|uniref:type IX secretion system plug protein n=1 Tax=Rhodocaloribacter litoris TaxID=2558931 RepID=UPI001E48F5BD|nr:type IX secretion system plug protein domain-containing protein [Rhodocaloribacter litoris]